MKPSSRASAPPGEHTPERVGEESSINVRGFGACSLALQVRFRVFQASMGRTAAAGPNPPLPSTDCAECYGWVRSTLEDPFPY